MNRLIVNSIEVEVVKNKPHRRLPKLQALWVGVFFALLSTNILAADNDELALRLAKLESTLNNRALIDMADRIEALQAEVQTLRGQLEEQQYTIEQLRKSQRDAYVDLDQRMQETLRGGHGQEGLAAEPPLTVYQPGTQPEVAGTPAPGIAVRVEPSPSSALPNAEGVISADETSQQNVPPSPDEFDAEFSESMSQGNDAPNLAGAEVTAETGRSQNPDQAYREAFGLLKAGKYDESIEAFSLFLLDYPTSEYADNAQYWLGETYFVKQEYVPAIDEYRKLITDYPGSKKQSHAMLKIGYSFQRLGELDKAQTVLKELQTRYPGTTAARLAAERLQQILATSP